MTNHEVPAGLQVRPVRPDDAGRLQSFHSGLSPDTVRRRFFTPHPKLTESEAAAFTTVCPGRNALVAIIDGELAGVGRYYREPEGDAAEVAFVIADRHQGHGIGTLLLRLLADVAWAEGIRVFTADTLITNTTMRDVFRQSRDVLTVSASTSELGVTHILMPLVGPDPATPHPG